MIKPTVGRKVWYRPSEGDLVGPAPMTMQGNPRFNPQPLDATILAVWGDRCVNILVFDIMGKPFTKTSVTLLQEGDEPACDLDGNPVYGYAEWVPYQQGQAKAQAECGGAQHAKAPSDDHVEAPAPTLSGKEEYIIRHLWRHRAFRRYARRRATSPPSLP